MLLLSLFTILILTGCAKQDMVLTLHDDDSADFTMSVTIETGDLPFGESDLRGDLAEARDEAEAEGFEATIIDEDDLIGLEVNYSMDDISDLSDELFDGEVPAFIIEKVDENVRELTFFLEGDGDEMTASMLDSQLTIEFPSVPVEHNAHDEDGNSLTWYIDLSEDTEGYAEYDISQSSGSLNWLYIIVGAVIVVVIAGAVIAKRGKKTE